MDGNDDNYIAIDDVLCTECVPHMALSAVVD